MLDKVQLKNRATHFTLIFILTVIYFIAGKLSLSFAFLHQSASPYWIPTGISITSFVILGYRIWPAVFIGAFFVNITTAGTVATSVGIALGNTLEGVTALYLIKRFIGEKNIFEKPLNIFKYAFFVGLSSTIISAIVGVTSLYLGGFIEPENFFPILTTWWLGDMGGAIIMAPVFFLWITNHKIDWNSRKIFEATLILFLLIVTSLLIFVDLSFINLKLPLIVERYPYPFTTFPIIILTAFRFSLRETATAIFIFTLIALAGTLNGSDRMADNDPNLSLLNLQIFTGVVFLLIMSVSAAIDKQRKLEESLRIKVKQNSAISGLGLASLSGRPVTEIMQSSIQLLCNILKVDYCKILKLLPDGKELLLIDGFGWKDGLVGKTKVGSDLNSQAGFTLFSKEPVIVTDLNKEKRFNIPHLLSEHGVISGMSCIIYGKDKPFGIIGVHTKTKTDFSRDDIDFLQSVANIIALSVEKTEYEDEIVSSLNEKQILLREIHHRVKNNLQIISSLLSLQSGGLSENNFRDFFIKSQNRVKSIAIVHEMLYKNENISKINFKNYIDELSGYILDTYNAENIKINIIAENIFLDTEVTMNLGLIVNEIISNAVKHAFNEVKEGTITIELTKENDFYFLKVRDNGIGLPDSFDIKKTSTLGMHLISSLVKKIEGNLEIKNNVGTEFIITFEVN